MNGMVRKTHRMLIPALALLASGVLAQFATSQSKIACAVPNYDFGKAGNTAQVTHVFLVTNEGAAPLIITSIHSGCGCIVAISSTNVVAPGSNTEVAVRFDTANRVGPQHKAIYVQSNDRLNPILRLELIGDLSDVPKSDQPPAPVAPVTVTAGPGIVQATPTSAVRAQNGAFYGASAAGNTLCAISVIHMQRVRQMSRIMATS